MNRHIRPFAAQSRVVSAIHQIHQATRDQTINRRINNKRLIGSSSSFMHEMEIIKWHDKGKWCYGIYILFKLNKYTMSNIGMIMRCCVKNNPTRVVIHVVSEWENTNSLE